MMRMPSWTRRETKLMRVEKTEGRFPSDMATASGFFFSSFVFWSGEIEAWRSLKASSKLPLSAVMALAARARINVSLLEGEEGFSGDDEKSWDEGWL